MRGPFEEAIEQKAIWIHKYRKDSRKRKDAIDLIPRLAPSMDQHTLDMKIVELTATPESWYGTSIDSRIYWCQTQASYLRLLRDVAHDEQREQIEVALDSLSKLQAGLAD